jgi:hypothetical protein
LESVIRQMKKVLSISLAFLMLTALFHLSLATHYCGGQEAASKISFSGILASCGMESNENDLPATGTRLLTHCCDNFLVFFGTDTNYYPTFSSLPDSYNNHFQVINVPVIISYQNISSVKSLHTGISPPGDYLSSNVSLTDICTFRI